MSADRQRPLTHYAPVVATVRPAFDETPHAIVVTPCDDVRLPLDRLHEHSLAAPDCVTCPRCSGVLGSTTAPLHVYHFRGADLVSFSRGGE